MGETALPVLIKEIEEALKLDDDGNEKDAYKKYVGCTYRIATNLICSLRSTGDEVVMTKQIFKQVQLAQQCVDRMVALADNMKMSTAKSSPVASPSQSCAVIPSLYQPQHHIVAGVPGATAVSTSAFGAPVPALPDEFSSNSFTTPKNPSPMEIAQKRNTSLMLAYRTRMNRKNRSDFNAFSYSLTIQRKMAENLAIARAQEDELAKKIQARNLRLDEEAARRFSQAAQLGLSVEEQEHKQIYKNILEYENNAKWLLDWRKKLDGNPEDEIIINQLVQEVLRCRDHPITDMMKKYQFKVYEKIYPLLAHKHAMLDEIIVPLPKHHWTLNTESMEKIPNPSTAQTSLEDNRDHFSNTDYDDSSHLSDTHDKDDAGICLTSTGEAIVQTKLDIDSALTRGKQLESQLTLERTQAQLLLRQVFKDYEHYNEENFDDLFDNNEKEAVSDGSEVNFLMQSQNSSCDKTFQKSLSENHALKNSSQSEKPNSGPDLNDLPFQSLPADLNQLRQSSLDEEELSQKSSEAYVRHLKAINEDIHSYLEKLLVLMTIAYESLDSPIGRDQCSVCLEESFFKPIWKTLLRLFRVVNQKEELTLAMVMTKMSSITPMDLRVSDKFCLRNIESEAKPYNAAIEELCRLADHYTPVNKLECVVRVCRLIVKCVQEYYAANPILGKKSPELGADDLLPVLSYIVIQTGKPQLVAECHAVMEFINESYMMGEEGYCLTTLRTALDFVCSLATRPITPRDLSPS